MVATVLLSVLALTMGHLIPHLAMTSDPLNASVAKWLDNHAAAISITNDDWPIPGREPDIDSYVMEQGLVMGYEIVTGNSFYGDPIFIGPDDERIVYLMSELVPKGGFGYFGHGHNHIDHDELSWEEALESFRPTMKPCRLGNDACGLRLSEKCRARSRDDAIGPGGFRVSERQTPDPQTPTHNYNLPGLQLVPDNWFGLLALEMQSIEFADATLVSMTTASCFQSWMKHWHSVHGLY